MEPRDDVTGFREFVALVAPGAYDGGLYFVHSVEAKGLADRLVADAFPEFAGRIDCFGRDWLGRQFSLDHARHHAREPLVLMFEPGTGEALEVPATFAKFHEIELVDHTEEALAASFFQAWQQVDTAGPLHETECAGYKTPLFLGGADEVSNLERSDLDVYWSITGQLRVQTQL